VRPQREPLTAALQTAPDSVAKPLQRRAVENLAAGRFGSRARSGGRPGCDRGRTRARRGRPSHDLRDDADAARDDADAARDDADGDASHSTATAALAASTAPRHRPVRDGARRRPVAPDAAATPGGLVRSSLVGSWLFRSRLAWIGPGIVGRAGRHGDPVGVRRFARRSLARRRLESHGGEPPTAPERPAPLDGVRLPPRRARPRTRDLPRGALRRHRLADVARAPRSQPCPLHRQDRAASPRPGDLPDPGA
jgi:hypothetical protein